jgi:ferredoxin
MACKKVLSDQNLACTVLVTGTKSPGCCSAGSNLLKPLEADAVSVSGAFGGFSATVTVKGDQKQLTEGLGKETAGFDLVLDLQASPSYGGDALPLGYYAPGPDPAALKEAMDEMPEMRGQFKKPQFISFQDKLCFHGRSHTHDCRRCLEICPFGAIHSVDTRGQATGNLSAGQGEQKRVIGHARGFGPTTARKIVFDHYLCQGCGGCALVCPASAVDMVEPSREDMLKRLRNELVGLREGADVARAVVIAPPVRTSNLSAGGFISDVPVDDHGESSHMDERADGPIAFIEMEQITQVGLDILLVAFAYGAGSVLVACGSQNPPKIRRAVEWQVLMAQAVLKGLGLPEDACQFVLVPPEISWSAEEALEATFFEKQTVNLPLVPASFPPGHDRRTLVRLAVQHLYAQSGGADISLTLPVGAPFGTVTVGASCTLCMACASACPAGALSAGGDAPRLLFRESRCLQCGLCETACPENAVRMGARLLCDLPAVEAAVALRETEPFRCIECGVPFASQSMVERMQEKLRGHWMYASEGQLRRLKMCVTCRTRDAFASQDVRSWNRQ